MADLSDIESSTSVKLSGASSSGVETAFAGVDALGRLTVHQPGAPTFWAYAQAVVVGNNKSMFAIQNTSAKVVRLIEIRFINNQTSAVTGVAGSFELHRIASFTGGTAITPQSADTNDSLVSGITVSSGATVSGEGATLARRVWSTDEWGPGTVDVEAHQNAFQAVHPQWNNARGVKPWTIRQNQGIHIKFATNSTAGAFDFEVVFTVEDA